MSFQLIHHLNYICNLYIIYNTFIIYFQIMESKSLEPKKLDEELKKQVEWAKAVIFNQQAVVIASKACNPKKQQLSAYFKAYKSRDQTIGEGFTLLGEHYDVHRFHPPLVYGRRGDAETGEGISLAVGKTSKGQKIYLLITYILPIISARAVPQQINFYNEFIGELQRFE